jgi:hypothetical protein
MSMGVIGYWTSAMLRRRWRATVVFALIAGLTAGAVLGLWAAGRRSIGAYDRFVRYVDEPPLNLQFCAPDVTQEQFVDNGGLCPGPYDAGVEQAFISHLPHVTEVARTSIFPVEFDTGQQRFGAGLGATVGPGLVSWSGNPLVIHGHLPTAPDEMAVNEQAAAAAGVHAGSTITATPLSVTTFKPIGIPPQRLRIAGIVRFPVDLAAAEHTVGQVTGVAFTAPAWWAKWGGSVQPWGTEVQVRMQRGANPAPVVKAVQARWPGRYIHIVSNSYAATPTVRDAISYEAAAMTGLGIAVAFASIMFVGQALSRQVRREQADLPALRSLGLTRGQAATAAAARALPVAVGAAVIAVALAWASSVWTPIGLGRRAEPNLGLHPDELVYLVGGLGTFLAVLVCMTVPALLSRARSTRRAVSGTRLAGAAGLPPPGVAGVGMATARRRGGLPLGAALVGLASAVAIIVASAVIGVSLERVVHAPIRYGAPWDAVVQAQGDDDFVPGIRSSPDVLEAAAIYEQDGHVDGQPTSVVSIVALKATDPNAWMTITAGRAPDRDSEVALGARTMHALGVGIGDTVDLETDSSPGLRHLTVVGRAVFNDSASFEAGQGALVRPTLVNEPALSDNLDAVAVRLRPGVAPARALDGVVQAGAAWFGPSPPASVRNLERIRWLPWALASAVALLAAAAIAHALASSVGANRGDLAVLRSMGFTRRQVRAAAGWEALTLGAAALVLGVPVGLLLGTWGWARLMSRVGIIDHAAVPPIALIAVPAGVVALVLVLSIWPGQRAAQSAPGLALRAE